MKITFEDFLKLFKLNMPENCCHEVLFSVEGFDKYQRSWLGVANKNNMPFFWFGLTPDSSEAYNYNSLDEMVYAPVFEGKSLKELWDKVEILSFDALDPEYIMSKHLN